MSRFRVSIVAMGLMVAAGGCVALPRLCGPGSERQQQGRAQLFEPYPESEPGPPVVGGRPREYASPRAEILRVQPRYGEPLLVPPPPSATGQAPALAPMTTPGLAPAAAPVQ